MLKGLGDIGQLMKMQKELKDIQKRLKKTEINGADRDGLVQLVINGEFKILKCEISEQLAATADRRKIEKAVIEAMNSAVDSFKKHSAEEMKRITGGMNIPGLGDLF
jgi:DNA-binding YbaB/EbfC family protein